MTTYMPDGKTPLVAAAREYATFAHAGQFRRDGVTPYITHPTKVAALLEGESDEVIAAAWLHDVVEDTGRTLDDLMAAGFPHDFLVIVAFLTKRDEQDYDTYLRRVYHHPDARKVKVADMIANLTDSPTPKQVAKYTRGLLFLAGRA